MTDVINLHIETTAQGMVSYGYDAAHRSTAGREVKLGYTPYHYINSITDSANRIARPDSTTDRKSVV